MSRTGSFLMLAFAVFTLLMGISLFYPSHLPYLHRMQQKKMQLLQSSKRLQTENQSLKEQIQLLNGKTKQSLDYIEQIARNELGFLAPDEVLIWMK